MKQKDGDKPLSLLLHKEMTIPAVFKAMVMSDPFHIPWSSVEFIRVNGVKEIERAEFK